MPRFQKQEAPGWINASDIPDKDLIEITWDEPYQPTLPMIDQMERRNGLLNTITPDTLV